MTDSPDLNDRIAGLPAAIPHGDGATQHHGWIYVNPYGECIEWDEQHPIESGEVPDATDIAPATLEVLLEQLKSAWGDLAEVRKDRDELIYELSEAKARAARAESALRERVGTKDAARLRRELAGVTCDAFGGDNLAIFLASEFEPGVESEELDESGTWKQGALDLADQVLDAIHAHYASAITTEPADVTDAMVERGARGIMRSLGYTEAEIDIHRDGGGGDGWWSASHSSRAALEAALAPAKGGE